MGKGASLDLTEGRRAAISIGTKVVLFLNRCGRGLRTSGGLREGWRACSVTDNGGGVGARGAEGVGVCVTGGERGVASGERVGS